MRAFGTADTTPSCAHCAVRRQAAKHSDAFPSCYAAAMHFFSKRAYAYAAKTLMRCERLKSSSQHDLIEEVSYSLAQCFVGTLASHEHAASRVWLTLPDERTGLIESS